MRILKNHEDNLSPKLPESGVLVNYTKSQTLCIETDIFLTVDNYISASEQLQNNTVEGTVAIAINRMISSIICLWYLEIVLCFNKLVSIN